MLIAKQRNSVGLHGMGGLPLSQRITKQAQFEEGEIPRLAMKLGKWIMAQTFSLCTVMEVNRDSQELG